MLSFYSVLKDVMLSFYSVPYFLCMTDLQDFCIKLLELIHICVSETWRLDELLCEAFCPWYVVDGRVLPGLARRL